MKKLNLVLPFIAVSLLAFAGFTAADSNSNSGTKPNQFNCVGTVLKSGSDEGPCVLISSRYVLVSATCLIDSKSKLVPVAGTTMMANEPYDQKVTDVNNVQIQLNGKVYDCEKLIVQPVYSDSIERGDCDIAIIKLKDEVKNITPATISGNFNEQSSKLVEFNYKSSKILKSGKLIDSLGGYKLNEKPTLLIKNVNTNVTKGNNSPDAFGILFSKINDTLQLTGFDGGSEYQVITPSKEVRLKVEYWTRVSVFADWIKKTIGEN